MQIATRLKFTCLGSVVITICLLMVKGADVVESKISQKKEVYVSENYGSEPKFVEIKPFQYISPNELTPDLRELADLNIGIAIPSKYSVKVLLVATEKGFYASYVCIYELLDQ